MTEEVKRVRMFESKAFQEKEQLRSKFEELKEEKERTCQVHLCVGFMNRADQHKGAGCDWAPCS